VRPAPGSGSACWQYGSGSHQFDKLRVGATTFSASRGGQGELVSILLAYSRTGGIQWVVFSVAPRLQPTETSIAAHTKMVPSTREARRRHHLETKRHWREFSKCSDWAVAWGLLILGPRGGLKEGMGSQLCCHRHHSHYILKRKSNRLQLCRVVARAPHLRTGLLLLRSSRCRPIISFHTFNQPCCVLLWSLIALADPLCLQMCVFGTLVKPIFDLFGPSWYPPLLSSPPREH
jgi:hypothetical protein